MASSAIRNIILSYFPFLKYWWKLNNCVWDIENYNRTKQVTFVQKLFIIQEKRYSFFDRKLNNRPKWVNRRSYERYDSAKNAIRDLRKHNPHFYNSGLKQYYSIVRYRIVINSADKLLGLFLTEQLARQRDCCAAVAAHCVESDSDFIFEEDFMFNEVQKTNLITFRDVL